jgi:hypothetical protein
MNNLGKITALVATLITGVLTVGGVIYNSERNLSFENRKLTLEQQKINLEQQKINFEQQKIELFQQSQLEKSSNSNTLTNSVLESNSSASGSDSVSSSILEFEFSNFDLLFVSYILFAITALLCVGGLLYNHLVNIYSNKLQDMSPHWIKQLIRYYNKYLGYTNYYFFTLLIFSQLCTILFSSYFLIRGVHL